MFLSQIPLKCDAHYTVYRIPSAFPERKTVNPMLRRGLQGHLGPTPYKRWSKCTMEKAGGSVFAET